MYKEIKLQHQPMKLSFVSAKRDDVPFLLMLRHLTMSEHLNNAGMAVDESYHLNRILEAFSDSLIISLDNENIGLIKLSQQLARLHIRQLQILPEFQNKGIGSRVIKAVIKKSAMLSLPVTLNVLLANPAKRLYLNHGFEVIGQNDLEYQMRYDHKPV